MNGDMILTPDLAGFVANDQLDAPSTSSAPPRGVKVITAASRKQNIACDACRAKKVRCQRTSVSERCEQCVTKGCDCTSHYVEQLQSKAKKGRKPHGEGDDVEPHSKRRRKRGSNYEHDEEERGGTRSSHVLDSLPGDAKRQSTTSLLTSYAGGRTSSARVESALQQNHATPSSSSMPSTRRPSLKHTTHASKQVDLLHFLFHPYAVKHHDWRYSDIASLETSAQGHCDMWEEDHGKVWMESPSTAHLQLDEDGVQLLADDLIESFFSIAHPRFPMFDPIDIRARIASPDTHPDGPLPHALLAVAIAFGARFSDHPAINKDREECTSKDGRHDRRMRSRIVQLLVIRAREVAEARKTHRVRSLDNVRVLVLLESMTAQIPFLKEKYQPHHFNAAIQHMCSMGYNKPRQLLSIHHGEEKTVAVYTWSLLCISDSFRAVFHRLSPCLSDADFGTQSPGPSSTPEALPGDADSTLPDQAVIWLGAATAGARMCRKMCADLWNHCVERDGIPVAALWDFVETNSRWRDNYLSRLGVPTKWPEAWDFLAAVTAASTDAFYHALWLVVDRAIREFGIAEDIASGGRMGMPMKIEVESARKRIRTEAEHGALRIAALTAVLYENAYLRLDPLIIHHPIYEAGLFLADDGRSECLACVAGLRQYSTAFPQFWETTDEIELRYSAMIARTTRLEKSNSGTGQVLSDGKERMASMQSGSWPSKGGENRSSTLAGNGYTSFPDVRNSVGGNDVEDRDLSLAILEWLQQA